MLPVPGLDTATGKTAKLSSQASKGTNAWPQNLAGTRVQSHLSRYSRRGLCAEVSSAAVHAEESRVDTLDALLARGDPGQRFVPGHGDVASRDDVAAFRDYLTTLRGRVMQERAQGKAGDVLARAVLPVLKEKYGRWDFAEPVANTNILEVEAELSGTKRAPKSQP